MSQVIVEEDSLKAKREQSRALEKKIQIEAHHQKWHLGGTAGVNTLAKIIGIAALPIIALWASLAFIMGFAFKVISGFFRLLGKVSPHSKTLSNQ